MKSFITITQKVEKEVAFLKVSAGVRYWEDGEVNGVEDNDDNPCMPFADASRESWEPVIEIATGKIVDWPQGTTASVHYKVCDAGVYILFDQDKQEVKSINGYVPDILCPKGGGYGDYIIMDIDAEGQIDKWRVDLDAFEQSGDDE